MLPIVILSGWAMPTAVMDPLVTALRQNKYYVITVPLPGVNNIVINPITWETLTQYVHKHIPSTPIILSGWSFGGTLAIHYATQYPRNISGIITLATNPSFLKKKDWPYGLPTDQFENFCNQFILQPKESLQEFAMTCDNKSHRTSWNLQNIWNQNTLKPKTLHALQKFLGYADLTSKLTQINCPIAHYLGSKDLLIPPQVQMTINQIAPHHFTSIIPGSHMFFTKNPKPIIEKIHYLQQTNHAISSRLALSTTKRPEIQHQAYKKRVALNFSRAAPVYDQTTQLQKFVAEKMRQLLLFTPPYSYLLDLGSGTGIETKKLADQYQKTTIIGLDIAEGMSKYAAKKHMSPNLTWCTSDMEALPFSCGTFHSVFSNLTVQWGQLDTILSEINRILKPRGKFLFSTLLEGSLKELSDIWKQVDNCNHINPFLTQKKLNSYILQSNFLQTKYMTLSIPVYYPDLKTLLYQLKLGGFNTVLSAKKGLTTPKKLKTLYTIYTNSHQQKNLTLTYQIAIVFLEKI